MLRSGYARHLRLDLTPACCAVGHLFSTLPDDAWRITQRDGQREVSVSSAGVSVGHHPTQRTAAPWSLRSLQRAVQSQLAATFLPAGHPASVSPGYTRYVWWQALHHGCSAANGVLASSFLLYAVGLSSASAIPTAGAVNWVLKDGLGQLGTMLFGRAIAHNFDVASRLWYVLASAKLNLAIGLEICSFLAPQHFVAIGSTANAVKGLAWMAGGSSRSTFNVAFACDNNIGDLTAKATGQTIATSFVGTSAGVGLACAVGQSAPLALACYAGLGAVHMWSGYQSARVVPLNTLNPSRTLLLVRAFLKQHDGNEQRSLPGRRRLPTPAELAPRDSIFHQGAPPWLRVGTPLDTLAAQHPPRLAQLLPLYRRKRHILVPGGSSAPDCMHLLLHEQAGAGDAVLGMLHATIWRREVVATDDGTALGSAAAQPAGAEALRAQAAVTLARAELAVGPLMAALGEAGWDTERVVLEARRRRATW